jgi:hypothetical protein
LTSSSYFEEAAAATNDDDVESPPLFFTAAIPPGVAALAAPRRVPLTSSPIEHRKACVNAAPLCSTLPRVVSARRADARANAYIVA